MENPTGKDVDCLMNAMSVDVEDYFHVSAFEKIIDRKDWPRLECRVERNVERILSLFSNHDARATFFFLGWIADKYPSLVKKTSELGHEIASHGYQHIRVTNQSREDFRQDVLRTKGLLEDLTGREISGYRAASFSIDADNDWAHDILAESGHRYSSSTHPVMHDHYGMPDAPRFGFRAGAKGIAELPVTTFEWAGFRLPCGGGGYFRLFPYLFSHWGLSRVNRNEKKPAIFYFHPWELDASQPRIDGVNLKTRFRHYVNLDRFERKLGRLLRDFRWTAIDDAFAEFI